MKYDLEYISKIETWIPVVGYEGLYEVSSFGRVRSLGNGGTCKTPKIKKQYKTNNGYLHVDLCKNGKRKSYSVHRLVAQSFLPNWFNEEQVNHKDEDKENNHVDNLEWCSSKYNINYGTRNKRVSEKMTNHINKSKPVLQFTKNGDFVAEFPSLQEVKRQLSLNKSHISSCCRGERKTCGGYIWKYKKKVVFDHHLYFVENESLVILSYPTTRYTRI